MIKKSKGWQVGNVLCIVIGSTSRKQIKSEYLTKSQNKSSKHPIMYYLFLLIYGEVFYLFSRNLKVTKRLYFLHRRIWLRHCFNLCSRLIFYYYFNSTMQNVSILDVKTSVGSRLLQQTDNRRSRNILFYFRSSSQPSIDKLSCF